MTNNITLYLVFFIYGLAFFTMGLAIALESRRASVLPMARGLKYLAAFGIIQSGVEWVDMLLVVHNGMSPDANITSWRILRVLMLALSTLCLLIFGTSVLTSTLRKYRNLQWLPAALFIIWLGSFVVPHLGWLPGGAGAPNGACLQCHWGQSQAYLILSGEWWIAADIWARYLLYVPGSILAAYAIDSQRSVLLMLRVPRIRMDCRLVAVAFLCNAIVAGLIVTPSAYFPASVLNYATFFEWVHVPPQVIRAALAVLIAFLILRILRVFEVEQRRQLETANRERFGAQLSSLEAQRQAREEIERANLRLEETVAQRTGELEALYTIGTEISALLDLDRILESVVMHAKQLLQSEVATLSLVDEGAGELVVRAVAGARTEGLQQLRIKIGGGVAGRAFERSEPVKVSDYNFELGITHELDAIVEAEGLTCHLAVPLRIADRTIGALYVADRANRAFGDGDARLLERFANQGSIAIENARLYAQVQNLAVLEERDRLAREMHDSLAQALGYLSMKAGVVAGLLTNGDTIRAQNELEEMERAADDAYADVRESILGLRSAARPGRDLLQTLSEYLKKYGTQHRIATQLIVTEGVRVNFAPATEVQVVRVIQEALSNVRKHARASRVWVTFERGAHGTLVRVADDGRGFDSVEVRNRSGDHFGLQSMQERVESVGGQLTVRSTIGHGTEIVVLLPELRNGTPGKTIGAGTSQ